MDKQDTKQNTELKKSVVQSVLLCLSCLFIYILTCKFIKKTEKKIKQAKKKIKSLNYAESNVHQKKINLNLQVLPKHRKSFLSITDHKWQKFKNQKQIFWKINMFLPQIYRSVDLLLSKYCKKNAIFTSMSNLGYFCEKLTVSSVTTYQNLNLKILLHMCDTYKCD